MPSKIQIGKIGEKIAKEYLIKNGYKIIAENFHCSREEIDIIAKDGEFLVFIEVKTRSNWNFCRAEDALDENKINKLRKAISWYLNAKNIETDYIRLDFIAINLKKAKKLADLMHFKEIF